MSRSCIFGVFGVLVAMTAPSASLAFGVSHHGGIILDCTAPIFFEESPGKDAKVPVFEKFSFTASDNTDAATLQVWVNAKPVKFSVEEQRSGRLAVEGFVDQPITSGKAWIKVTGVSHDGCDQLHNWNVFVGP